MLDVQEYFRLREEYLYLADATFYMFDNGLLSEEQSDEAFETLDKLSKLVDEIDSMIRGNDYDYD